MAGLPLFIGRPPPTGPPAMPGFMLIVDVDTGVATVRDRGPYKEPKARRVEDEDLNRRSWVSGGSESRTERALVADVRRVGRANRQRLQRRKEGLIFQVEDIVRVTGWLISSRMEVLA